MPKPLRVFFVSVAVLYALVLGWLVLETARIAAAVPPQPCRPSSAAPRTFALSVPFRSTPRSSIGSTSQTARRYPCVWCRPMVPPPPCSLPS